MFNYMPRHIKRPATAREVKHTIYEEFEPDPEGEKFFLGYPNKHKDRNNIVNGGPAFWKKTGSPILEFLLTASNRQIAFARYHGLDLVAPVSLYMEFPYGHLIHPDKYDAFGYLASIGDYENLRILFQKVNHPELTKRYRKELIDIAMSMRKATLSGPITNHRVPHTNPLWHKHKNKDKKEEPFVQRDCVPLREPIKTCTDRSWTPTSLLLMIVLGNIVVTPFVDQFIKLIERILPCLQ